MGMTVAAHPGRQKPYPAVTTVKDGVKEIMNPEYPRDGRFKGELIPGDDLGRGGATERSSAE